jgi:hypothetical protein
LEKAEANSYQVPLTDDGCFLAYKAVRNDYLDCYTGKVDNSVGQTPMMPRKAVDPDRRNQCSQGYHFCSLGYLASFSGNKIMAVKVNPKDVVAIPEDYNYTKGRTWKYEVVYEVADKDEETSKTHALIMQKAVVPVAAERKQVIADLLAIPALKRAIRRGKIKKTTIMKQSYGQLAKLLQRWGKTVITATKKSTVLENSLMDARNAAGLTIGQVARELDITYKSAWALEHSDNPNQEAVDKYLVAIAHLSGMEGSLKNLDRVMVSFPKPSDLTKYVPPVVEQEESPLYAGFDSSDEFDSDQEEDDEYND